jgi:sarcosine oxidase subunit beta
VYTIGMAETCEVAIVGGGVIGMAIARELGRQGQTGVVLVEKGIGPGMGSTARANGGVRAQFTTRSNVEFSLYTIRELETLQRETAGLPGFEQAGYLLMAGTPKTEAGLRKGYELQRSLGVPVEWWNQEQVLAKAPWVRADNLRCGTFCGRDGLIDPHGVVQAIWQQTKRYPIDLRFSTSVTSITRAGETYVLATSRGELRARFLVNAAGPDAKDVARLAGVDLPCEPVRRNLAATDPMPGFPAVIPMCVDLDTGVLIRKESKSGGFVVAYSDPSEPPGRDTSVDPRFLEQVAERAGNRFPFLLEAGIHARHCWAGLYPETPDHHAIVGPAPGQPRFLQCVGFGGHGIMHSLAAACAITELVTRGRSETLDIRPLRFERFAEGDLVVETAVL